MGRPTLYTEELAKEICEAVANNGISLARICKKYPHFPAKDTIKRWRREKEDFRTMYAQAKQEQMDELMDEVLDICDDGTNDYYVNDEGNECFNGEHVQRSRLRIDTRKFLAIKLAPRVYGTKSIEIGLEGSLLEKFIDKL